MNISARYIQEHLISMVYKMLCWREENKNWQRLYEEMIMELSMNNGLLDDTVCGEILFRIAPLKYLEESYFKTRIFEVINYLNGISRL